MLVPYHVKYITQQTIPNLAVDLWPSHSHVLSCLRLS